MESSHPKGTCNTNVILLSSILLAACGSGNGGAPPKYTIGGTVSGLVGTVVLQNNGGDNLTLTANGGFSFSTTVLSGRAYTVVVLTQPTGPSCTVTNASGTATSNVATVSVVCASDPKTFYLPLSAQPPYGTMAGTTGLYALSSKVLDRAPGLIMSGSTKSTGYSLNFAINSSGHLSGGQPFALAFTTQDATGGDHVYAVDLTSNSTLVAMQISSLAFLPMVSQQNCGIEMAYANLTDPSSAFFIIEVPTDPTNVCGAAKRLLVHLNDPPTTAPIELPAIRSTILALYQPTGALAGFVMKDSANNLNFYQGQTFTNPTVLLTNVLDFEPQQSAPLSQLTNVSADPTYSLIIVLFTNQSSSLYRVDYTGTTSGDLYDFNGDPAYGAEFDSNNWYFTDFANSTPTQTDTIAQVPLDGSARATVLFHLASADIADPYQMIGPAGSQLVVANSATLSTLPLGAAGSPTPIATFPNSFSAQLWSGDLFVSESIVYPPIGNPSVLYFSTSLMTDGAVLQPRTARSAFLFNDSDVLLRITNATEMYGLGGGSVSVIGLAQPSSPTQTVLNDSNGAPFTISTGVQRAVSAGVTSTIGYITAYASADYFTYIYDLSKNLMVPVTIPSADVQVVQAPN